MSAVRIVITDSSVWTFNFTEMRFNRSPRVEGANHPFVKYTGDWRPFQYITEGDAYPHEADRIRLTVHGRDLDGNGAEWITTTYRPAEQGAAK